MRMFCRRVCAWEEFGRTCREGIFGCARVYVCVHLQAPFQYAESLMAFACEICATAPWSHRQPRRMVLLFSLHVSLFLYRFEPYSLACHRSKTCPTGLLHWRAWRLMRDHTLTKGSVFAQHVQEGAFQGNCNGQVGARYQLETCMKPLSHVRGRVPTLHVSRRKNGNRRIRKPPTWHFLLACLD
jgi:hypothetical protein